MIKLLSILLLTSSHQVLALNLKKVDWKLLESNHGVEIFEPKSFTHNSGIVPLRFKLVLKHNISRVLTVLDDSERKHEWLPSVKLIKELEVPNINEKIVYYRYKTPWLLKERDFIIHNIGTFDKKTMSVNVTLKSVNHKLDPFDKTTIRGISYDGYSVIKVIDHQTTEVEMAFLNDFKGSIPTFIVNYVQAKWPYQFAKNVRKQLSREDIKINPNYILKE